MKFPFLSPLNSKWKKCFLWASAGFVTYCVVGFFLLPPIIKSQLVKRLAEATHRKATVRQVKLNPLALSLTIRGLSLTESNGEDFASFEEFYANFQLSSLFRWAWTFDEILLAGPRGEIVLNQDRSFNFSNLAQGTNAAPGDTANKSDGVPPLMVFSMLITNGHVGFADFTRQTPFRTAYEPINLHLKRFTTKPDRESPYSFEASTDQGRLLEWGGTVTAQPPASSGTLRIFGFPFPKHGPYLEDYTRAQLTGGKLDVSAGYEFLLETNGMDLVVSNLAVMVSNLEFKDPDTSESVLAVPRYELKGGSLNWRTREARIGSIVISDPACLVRRRPDGSLNLPSLFVKPTGGDVRRDAGGPGSTNDAPTQRWIVVLDEYRLQNGTVEIEDACIAGPLRTTLKPVDMQIQNFTTRPDSDASLVASLRTEAGETVKFEGSYSIDPIRAGGTLDVGGVQLTKYRAYIEPVFRGGLAGGTAASSVRFAYSGSGSSPEVTISNTQVRVSGLEVKAPNAEETLLSVPELVVDDIGAKTRDQFMRVGSITSHGGKILVRREADGSVNLLGLLAQTDEPASATPSAKPETGVTTDASIKPGWELSLESITITNYALLFEDTQTRNIGVVGLDQLAMRVGGLRFPSNAPAVIHASMRVNGQGTVSARGTVRPYSPAAEVELDVADLDLKGFQPWLEPAAKLAINSGRLTTQGRVGIRAPEDSGPLLKFEGGLLVTNLLTTDQVYFKEFVRWTELGVKGAVIELEPTRAEIEQVRFAGLRTSVVLGPDKRPNFLVILPEKKSADHTSANPSGVVAQAMTQPNTSSKQSLPLHIKELALENAALHFGDQSVQPACAFDIKEFGGTIRGLSSEPGTVAELEVAGRIDDSAPFGLRGKINPLSEELALDLAFTNRNLQLTPFTTYLEKYAGHPLLKGRLSLDLAYGVQHRQLQAKNQVHLDQFTLGPRNESPDATKLPVKLAVALLKDSEGRIDLDLPLSGQFDDPDFRVAPLVLKVIGNVIVKAATSPFKLLGALVGGGEELSFVEFEPGKAVWREGETNKLAKLIKALQQRPALSLEIQGTADPVQDRDAIAMAMVQERIKTARLQELATVQERNKTRTEEGSVVEPAHHERLLRAAVAKEFGTNITAALAELASAATNEVARPNAAPERKGVMRGAMEFVSMPFQGKNHPAAVARRQAKADAALLKQNPELGTLTAKNMELLLASRTEVPQESLLRLMQDRARTVQTELLKTGGLSAERLFLIAPKPVDPSVAGEARVNLSLN